MGIADDETKLLTTQQIDTAPVAFHSYQKLATDLVASLSEVNNSCKCNRHDKAVYDAQTIVELSLKELLKALNVKFELVHNPDPHLITKSDIDLNIKEEDLARLKMIIDTLASWRGRARYGDNASVSSSEIFSDVESTAAAKWAKEMLLVCLDATHKVLLTRLKRSQ